MSVVPKIPHKTPQHTLFPKEVSASVIDKETLAEQEHKESGYREHRLSCSC